MRGDHFLSRVRSPVRRARAERYLLLMLLSFAASVALTRLFLELTGYPQLGGGELHIAHVLWGGLLLFAASLLPLIFANRWAYVTSALASGVGVGLFIDEVGKFITQSNDYFYPAAAPIIYAFFLISVLIYLQARRPPPRDARAELYRALEGLQEVLDHDLEPDELAELHAALVRARHKAPHPDLARLAESLEAFLESEALHVAPQVPGLVERLLARLKALEARWITPRRLKAVLVGGLAGLGMNTALNLVELAAVRNPARLEAMIAELVALGRVSSAGGAAWFAARMALEGGVALALLVAALLLLLGCERLGLGLAWVGLLLSLAAVNLVVFYFDQFSTTLTAGVQFLLLLGVLYYRRAYLRRSAARG